MHWYHSHPVYHLGHDWWDCLVKKCSATHSLLITQDTIDETALQRKQQCHSPPVSHGIRQTAWQEKRIYSPPVGHDIDEIAWQRKRSNMTHFLLVNGMVCSWWNCLGKKCHLPPVAWHGVTACWQWKMRCLHTISNVIRCDEYLGMKRNTSTHYLLVCNDIFETLLADNHPNSHSL